MAILRKNICTIAIQDKTPGIIVNIDYRSPIGFVLIVKGQIFDKLLLFLLTAAGQTLYFQE
jgi:hypothetical protein